MAEDAPEQHDTLHGVPAPVYAAALFGHDRQAAFLANAYQSGRLHHALLFEGPAGIGKASLAFQLAQHLISQPVAEFAKMTMQLLDRQGPDFRQLVNGTHLQILHLTRPFDAKTEKFKTMVTVDEIRRISHFLSRTNTGQGFRMIIIDPANDMNANAANALLKNLEEPPARTVFVLIAHSAGRILPTIRSRCQALRFEPLSLDDLTRAVRQTSFGAEIDDASLERIAGRAEGSVRRALMLAGFGGLEVTDAADKVIDASSFDIDKAGKLGDAMTPREADIQYQLLTDHLLRRLSAAASLHAKGNDMARAGTMARSYSETRRMLIEAQAFNLDRKQTIVGLIAAMHEKMRAGLM